MDAGACVLLPGAPKVPPKRLELELWVAGVILSKRLVPLVACVVGAALLEDVGKPKILEVLEFVFVFVFGEPKGFVVVFVFWDPKKFDCEFAGWLKMEDMLVEGVEVGALKAGGGYQKTRKSQKLFSIKRGF